jgi:hypothetical protein
VLSAALVIATLGLGVSTPASAQVEFVPDVTGRKWVPKSQVQQRRYQEAAPAPARGQRQPQRSGVIVAPAAPQQGGGFFPWFVPRQTIPAATQGGGGVEVIARNGGDGGGGSGQPGQSGQYFCVRLCDGFYFPLPPEVKASDTKQRQMVCSGMCRGAETRLFQRTGGGGEEAEHELGQALTSAIGKAVPYTKLPAAFRYRDALVPGCGCQAPEVEAAEAAKREATTPTQTLPTPVFLSRYEDPDTIANRTAATRPLNDGGSQAEAEEVASTTARKVRIVGPSYFVAQ